MVYDLIATYGSVAMAWALAALASAGAWLLVRLGAQAAVKATFEALGAHARDVVQEVWQVYVEGIKLGRADGYLTPTEKAHARDMAIAKLKQRLTLKNLVALGGGWLAKLLGGEKWKKKVDDIIGGAVETAIAESKRDARAAGISSVVVPKVAVLPSSTTSPPPSATTEATGGPPISPR